MRPTVLLLVPMALALCSAESMSFTGPQCRFLEQMRVNVTGICKMRRGNNRQAQGNTARDVIASSPRVSAAVQQARQTAASNGRPSSSTGSPSAPGRPSAPSTPGTPSAPSAPSLAAAIRGQVNAATAGLGDNIRGQVNAATSGLDGLGAQISGQVNGSVNGSLNGIGGRGR